MIIARKPPTWSKSMRFCRNGIALEPHTLRMKTMAVTAETNRVPCQFVAS
jgi:hypothetical protein